MGKSAGSKAGGGGGGGGKGKSTGSTGGGSGLTPEQEQNLKNFVYATASKYHGYTINPDSKADRTINKDRLNSIVSGGWGNIPNGEIVYVSALHKGDPRPGEKWYRKIDKDTVVDQSGKQMKLEIKQKNNMLGTYALQKAVAKQAYG